ncbi:hypothetical protein [Chryseoglobus sp. 28M-23]|nr:hypothetical protein [Chryseoglobus sp. 28M-23]QOD93543.1 hypothetical protein IE160_11680 [Chryseoglobus sp. 28M-23]
MGEKSARKNTAKTAASKTLKEKRVTKADKKAASNRMESSDAVSKAAKR